MAELAPGEKVGDRFTIVGPIGRGGMATVYLANDEVRGGPVALKVLHDHLASDPAMRRRLRREVVAAGLVRHEAALVAHDLHELPEGLALTMPYHPGATLAGHVRQQGRLGPEELRALGGRLAGALAEAHRKGVLHRDLTPNNVLIETSGEDGVLADFGLAHTVGSATATATSALGTPGYAPPEVLDGKRTDPRSDLYGLGATLYYAATGQNPFGSGSPGALLRRQLAHDIQPLSELAPDLPPDLVATIERLMAPLPEQRPESAVEVVRALELREPVAEPVPDTWGLPEPTVPSVAEPAAVRSPGERGSSVVVVKRRRGADDQRLLEGLRDRFGLDPQVLAGSPTWKNKRFRLAPGTDESTARVLEELAETAGFHATVFDAGPRTALEQLGSLVPLAIPLVWVAFPFLLVDLFGPKLALLFAIGITLAASGLASVFPKKQLPEGLPLLLKSEDVFSAPTPAVATAAEPAAVVDTPRHERLHRRVLVAIDNLERALEEATALPDAAAQDLRRNARALRGHADELLRAATGAASALDEVVLEDVTWVQHRLARLATEERAGMRVDGAEKEKLERALARNAELEDETGRLEARLTSAEAQLLEMMAVVQSVRSDLETSTTLPTSGVLAVERLEAEAAAIEATRREMANRHQNVAG